MPEERPDFNEILLSLEDMKRDPAFQRHRSVPSTPSLNVTPPQHISKSADDASPLIGASTISNTSNASDKSAHSLQERIDYSSSSDESDSDSDHPPPKEKITSGYVE